MASHPPSLSSRLSLGTAQFGLDYGVTNSNGRVNAQEVSLIFDLAKRSGVRTLDTAPAYGKAEELLGKLELTGFDLVTKVPKLPSHVDDVCSWIISTVELSLSNLKQTSIKTVLLHSPMDLLGPNSKGIQDGLIALKRLGYASQIGYSIYAPAELEELFGVMQPDIVQAPFSLFDQRLLKSGWLQRLKSDGVEVHTRSVFLQGALLSPVELLPPHFDPWKQKIQSFQSWARMQNLAPFQAALGYVMSHQEVDKIIVGVETEQQLSEIVSCEKICFPDYPDFSVKDESLINPNGWGK